MDVQVTKDHRFARLHDLITWFGSDRVVVNSFSSHVVQHFHDAYPDVPSALDVNKPIGVSTARW